MQDSEIQKKLLKGTVYPGQPLIFTIKKELGRLNRLQISNSQSSPKLNIILPQGHFLNANRRLNLQPQIRSKNQLCQNCGLTWSINHRIKYIAKRITSNSCGLQNHFAHVCRKTKSTPMQTTRSNVNLIEAITTDDSDREISNMY